MLFQEGCQPLDCVFSSAAGHAICIWPSAMASRLPACAGLGSDDHCRAYPSDAYRRRRDSYRRKSSGPTPSAPQQPLVANFFGAPESASIRSRFGSSSAGQSSRSKSAGLARLSSSENQPQSATIGRTAKSHVKPAANKPKVLKMHMQLSSPRLDKEYVPVGVVKLPVKVRIWVRLPQSEHQHHISNTLLCFRTYGILTQKGSSSGSWALFDLNRQISDRFIL